jgi:hypothetical protein
MNLENEGIGVYMERGEKNVPKFCVHMLAIEKTWSFSIASSMLAPKHKLEPRQMLCLVKQMGFRTTTYWTIGCQPF